MPPLYLNTCDITLEPAIFLTQFQHRLQACHVPEIVGHVRRDTHLRCSGFCINSFASGFCQFNLPVYTPKAGFSQASLLLGSDYLLTKKWIVGARASFGQLEGDAGKSPITQKKAQNEAGIYFGYKF
jgi:hypothetical protein